MADRDGKRVGRVVRRGRLGQGEDHPHHPLHLSFLSASVAADGVLHRRRRVLGALEEAGIEIESAELTMLPKTTVRIEDEAAARKLLRLMDALEENDDVQDVYANFDIPEGMLEAVAA